MTAWRFIDSGLAPGAGQMALDEALLLVCRPDSPPVLRVFSFQPFCLSLGRFQPARGQIDSAACRQAGVDVVRRPTGGRAVLHTTDLCYAIVAPVSDPLAGGAIRDSYCNIAAALSAALARVGLPPEGYDAASLSKPAIRTDTAACFATAAEFEPSSGGAKLIGSAQVRRGKALLQQGSVRLAATPDLESLLLAESAGLPSLSGILARPLDYAEMAAALRESFIETFTVDLDAYAPTTEEQELARRLAAEKYGAPAWTWQR